jgi:signal transduction histidine kinase
VTRVVRDGELVALVRHDKEVVEPEHLERQLGPAALLAIENERLGAEVLARLQELQRSRARIVAAGDAERRRLERDLHDGAQQRLVALAYDLRVARAAAQSEGQAATLTLLDGAIDDARACHEALRDLAHGIYPAILAEAGLEVALQTLADRAPVALSLTLTPGHSCEGSARSAVYAAVDQAIADAAGRGASQADVTIGHAHDAITISVEDDGSAQPVPPVHLADLVGAASGQIRTVTGRLLANRLEVDLPCA